MIAKSLEKIASRNNAKYEFKEETISMLDGSCHPRTSYKLELFYKNCIVNINVNTGYHEFVRASCFFPKFIRPIKFKISSVSPFENLFYLKKTRFKITCENETFKTFLTQVVQSSFISKQNNRNFTPETFFDRTDGANTIITEYHLGFEDWITTIDPLINFYKAIIDYFTLENLANQNLQY